MYSQLNPALLKLSTTANFDNLSIIYTKDCGALLAVHDTKKVSITWVNNEGNVDDTILVDSFKNDKTNTIQMVHLMKMQEKIFLIVLSSKIIRIFSTDNECKMLFDHNFNPDLKNNKEMINGIEKIGKDSFCFATQGKIHFIELNGNGQGFHVKDFPQDLKSSAGSIIHKFLGCGPSQYALIENSGKIIVWKLNDKNLTFSKVTSFDIHPNTKVTCVQVFKHFLLIGTVSGQIQIVNVNDGQLLGEIQAHIKCITSLDVASSNGFLISGSEDSFARLFKLKMTNENECQVEYKQQFIAPNEMIFGAKFLNPDGTYLAISTFESNQIKLFKSSD